MVHWLTGYEKVSTFHDYAQRQKNACGMDTTDMLICWCEILAYYLMS